MPVTGAAVGEAHWPDLPAADRAAVGSIYEASFPAAERRPLSDVLGAGSRLWLARRGPDVLGLALVAPLPGADAALLQYLAVDPRTRSGGTGTLVVRALAADLAAAGGTAGVLIEIEDPTGAADDATRRRQAFYRRLGARPVDCLDRYFMADFTGGQRIPMQLLWLPLRGAGPPRGTALRAALTGIFASEYAGVADARFLDDLLAGVIC